jgi:membrane protein YdbS with pleckstrin-like domain
MVNIRRSPVGLVIKIIVVEVLVELTYLLLSTAVAEVRGSVGESYAATRIAMSLVFMTIAISAVIMLVSQWVSESYYITDKEVIIRRGVIAKTEIAYPFTTMQTVSVRQGGLHRLFKFGQLHILIASSASEIVLNDVADVQAIAEHIRSKIPYADASQFIRRTS